MKKDFSKIAFYSKLFKGRSNWYYCYLKSEKLALALALIVEKSSSGQDGSLKSGASLAGQIVQDVLYAATGEVSEETLLGDLFSMLSTLRLHAARGLLHEETAKILIEEYEGLVEKLVGESKHVGLSITSEALAVSTMAEEPLFAALPSPLPTAHTTVGQKDIYKGHKDSMVKKDGNLEDKGQKRTLTILEVVKNNDGVSIKDISKVVQGCSEKTIQRELGVLIEQGVVVRKGERRWSTYHPA